jgi:hypothetical protein
LYECIQFQISDEVMLDTSVSHKAAGSLQTPILMPRASSASIISENFGRRPLLPDLSHDLRIMVVPFFALLAALMAVALVGTAFPAFVSITNITIKKNLIFFKSLIYFLLPNQISLMLADLRVAKHP